jgi:protein ImuA
VGCLKEDGKIMAQFLSHAAQHALLENGVHEIYAASHADAACLSGFALMLGQAKAEARANTRTEAESTVLWIRPGEHEREAGSLSPAGLMELGIDPARILLLQARDGHASLQAALEGARTLRLGAVIVELWGEAKAYDLTASRRLTLAAKVSGTPVLVARSAATPIPSAAQTRWLVRAAPSRALAAQTAGNHAPGNPAFYLTLLRARNGQQQDLQYHLEWNRDATRLEIRPSDPGNSDAGRRFAIPERPPLSGALVPVSFHRQGASRGGPASRRRSG